MFTGIVEELGQVIRAEPDRLTVQGRLVTADAAPGDSIAVDGVCLTVVTVTPAASLASLDRSDAEPPTASLASLDRSDAEPPTASLASLDRSDAIPDGATFTADVMAETWSRTALGRLTAGDPVNLERAATASSRLGGHLVQGHVDGVGTIRSRTPGARWQDLRMELPAALTRYLVEKGSVAVDGVSLTVTGVGTDWFEVSLVPTTLELTTLGRKQVGDPVNLEVDVIAKYVEKLVTAVRP